MPARAIGEHVSRCVALVQEPIQLLAVVDRRIAHLVTPDQLVLGIRIHVILIVVKALAMLLRPAGILVLLSVLGRLLLPILRRLGLNGVEVVQPFNRTGADVSAFLDQNED